MQSSQLEPDYSARPSLTWISDYFLEKELSIYIPPQWDGREPEILSEKEPGGKKQAVSKLRGWRLYWLALGALLACFMVQIPSTCLELQEV